jgi:protein ImuB
MVSVWLPIFPIERLQREMKSRLFPADAPFALVGNEDRGLKLTAVNGAAERRGLYPGLSLADARAIYPSLLTAPADPGKDDAALLALARWARRFSPSLNTDGTDGIWLDVTGVPHLFGGEAALLDDIAIRLARLGFTANIAMAETLGAAHALARYGRKPLMAVPREKTREALASLPVEALRIDDSPARLLKRLGLKRIGQLYDLPRASLERRFHSRVAAEAVLLRLDQALGRREERLRPLRQANEFAARLSFAEPLITHEGIMASLDRLAAELQAQLEVAMRGAKRLKLSLYRADGSAAVVQAGLSAPSRKKLHLARLLADKLAAVDAGFGIDLMVLASPLTEALPRAQSSFAEDGRSESQEILIDRLACRLGEAAVRRLFAVESHRPERAQKARSAFGARPDWQGARAAKPPRPPVLLARPEPLSVLAEVPEGPPARFTWRRVTRMVKKSEGPERIAPEWWLSFARREHASTHSPLRGAEGSTPQIQSVPLTPHPVPLPQGERGRSGPAANSIPPLDGEGGMTEGGRGKYAFHSGLPLQWESPGASAVPARTRDYYRIEDADGHRYWVFREGLYQESGPAPEWYLHGVFE